MKDRTGMQESTETVATGDPHTAEGRRGPTWRGWVLSILAAILLSVTATLLLAVPVRSGRIARRPERATADPALEAATARIRPRESERRMLKRKPSAIFEKYDHGMEGRAMRIGRKS